VKTIELNPNDKNRNSRARMTIETQLILNCLLNTSIGDLVSYESLQKIAGLENLPTSKNLTEYGRLHSARRIAEMQGVFFDCVSKTEGFYGLKRISEAEAVSKSQKGISHIRKRSRLEVRRLVAIPKYSELDPESRMVWNRNMTMFKLFDAVASPKGIENITSRVIAEPRIFNFGEVARLFNNNKEQEKTSQKV
jgi:hypothetical protein